MAASRVSRTLSTDDLSQEGPELFAWEAYLSFECQESMRPSSGRGFRLNPLQLCLALPELCHELVQEGRSDRERGDDLPDGRAVRGDPTSAHVPGGSGGAWALQPPAEPLDLACAAADASKGPEDRLDHLRLELVTLRQEDEAIRQDLPGANLVAEPQQRADHDWDVREGSSRPIRSDSRVAGHRRVPEITGRPSLPTGSPRD